MLFGCSPHCKEPIQKNWKQIFPEKELRSHSPIFQINVSVSDLYIHTIDLPILLQEYADRSWENINHSKTHESGNLDWGRAIPRKGIHTWDFPRIAYHRVLALLAIWDFQGVIKRCRLSWLLNSAYVYEPKCGEGNCRVLANEYSCKQEPK